MDPVKKENRAVCGWIVKSLDEVAEACEKYKDEWTLEQWKDGEVPAAELREELSALAIKLENAWTRMSYYREKE